VIRFENVSTTYPGQNRAALADVNVDIEKGEFVFLVGASGSGKSTFLRLVLREARPNHGRVYVAGKEINRMASWKVPALRRKIGTVFQDFRLDGKGDRMPDELSGGEQQRVAIARAFVNRPMILIADEPTGNLDPNTSVGIMKLLDRINRTGTTVIMATHDAGIVDQMRKRVIELSDGNVIRDQSRGVYGFQH
jgi:cell division transport system ATP-binding protein